MAIAAIQSRFKIILLVSLWTLCGLFTLPAHALDTVSVTDDVNGIALGLNLNYLADPSGELKIKDVLARKNLPWQKSRKPVPGFGFTTTPYWFTVEVRNELPVQNKLLLEVGTSVLDHIEVYYVSYDTVTNAYHTGDKMSFTERPIPHRNFLFPLMLGPKEKVQVYIRVQTTTALQLPLALWSEDNFYNQDVPNIYAHGLFYGIMLVAMLFSLFMYISIREKQYLYYSLYVLFHTMFQAAAHGISFQYLWPEEVWWHEKSVAVFSGTAIVFSALFAIEFLSLRESRRKLYFALALLAIASGITVLAGMVIPYSTTIRIIIPLALLMVIGCFAAGVSRWGEGDNPARIYTIAWAMFLLGIALLTLNRLDIIPRTLFTENAMQVGAAIEVILLLRALTERLSQEIRKRFEVQEQALAQQQNANLELESKVEERTAELANKNKQLEAMSNKLSKYLSPQLYQQIFQGKRDVALETRRKKLTVFFSDIKDFTRVTDSMESEALTELLNHYLNDMAEIALRYGGTVDKFIGDAVMVFFGDPESRGYKQDAIECVMMALEMRKRMVDLRARWANEGISTTPLQVRVGINTGYCTVGNFGSDNRLEYTIIGGEVNVASRLEASAEPNDILISENTYALVKDHIVCEHVEDIHAKGIDRPIHAYRVIEANENLAGGVNQIQEENAGFILSLDLNVADRNRVASSLEKALEYTRRATDTNDNKPGDDEKS
jgi:class 3 adenylate cyclase